MKTKLAFLISSILVSSLPVPLFAFTPNDPRFSNQWYLEQVSAAEAWDLTQGSVDVVVAVLDSGVDLDHPDLVSNLWKNAAEIAGDAIDNDQNGYIDDVHGWDFVEDDASPTPSPDKPFDEGAVAHGTAIAGVIGAVGNNGLGVAGIAWNVQLMPVRILDNYGSGTSDDAARAVRYAVENGADIINLSFTGSEIDTVFERAVRDAWRQGVLVVAAVGNAEDGGVNLDETPMYPACFQEMEENWVVGVAATTPEDTKALFSNYGSNCTDISAPGVDVFSTMYQNKDWASFSAFYQGEWAGTSIASPIVAGAAALLKGAYPTLTPAQVLTALQLSADPLQEKGTDAAGNLGAGRLNIATALVSAQALLATTPPSPPPDVAPGSGQFILSPITGQLEEVSQVSPGWFIRSPSFDTVYLVDAQLRRHPFWNATTFMTWADSWEEVVHVTDVTLSTLPLAPPVVPKPGVALVKIQSDPNVYAVEAAMEGEESLLRRLPSESIAIELYGEMWAEYVLDIEPTLFTQYQRGEEMSSQETIDSSLLRTRLDIAARVAGG